MKVLLSWLAEFAPIAGDPQMLADELSDLGLAVEDLVVTGEGLDGIVVARVLQTRPHPDADRVQLVDVDRGDGEALQIVCGAFNMAAGDLVPLATLGTVMPNGMEIARRKMRGEWSNGMLCSASELGFGTDHDGIMLLGDGLTPGAELKAALGIERDVLFDLDVTGNRPDAMSVMGVARDLAARLSVPFQVPEPRPGPFAAGASAPESASVEIVDRDLCGRFVARILRDVAIGPSPRHIANRLVALGMRPINNVVDASNYVMLELGQPNHTFDLASIAGSHLRVRWARPGETLVTLDDQRRTLLDSDGVIADGQDVPVSLAGVMGGASTEISDSTRDVLLEMAWWRPMAIARTARRLNLRSEASTRFERGTDPGIIEVAMARFAELLGDAGSLAPGTIDVPGDLPAPARVRVRTAKVNALLGTQLAGSEMAELIGPIGFESTPTADPDVWEVQVPSWRPDSSIEEDVAEEVARHFGYRRLGRRTPIASHAGSLTALQADRRLLRRTLVGWGLTEAMPLPFLAPGDLDRAGLGADAVTVTNPLVAEESVLRTSLRPGLLKTLAYNASHRNPGGRLFELGHVFLPTDRSADLPDEREHLAAALAGAEAPEAVEALWAVADALRLEDVALVGAAPDGLHPTRS
ncbi:MAG: phenylalanine--tRNA ligase subunit beta, partial [Acidimicrobiia bacterium]|nr:phenylalanine--tRNA ligase subunit beta [Acidimicrobiia bacterium]